MRGQKRGKGGVSRLRDQWCGGAGGSGPIGAGDQGVPGVVFSIVVVSSFWLASTYTSRSMTDPAAKCADNQPYSLFLPCISISHRESAHAHALNPPHLLRNSLSCDGARQQPAGCSGSSDEGRCSCSP